MCTFVFRRPFLRQYHVSALFVAMSGTSDDLITDDFAAAFLHAGISVHKLDHPSIRGLIQKYTQVFMDFLTLLPSFILCRSVEVWARGGPYTDLKVTKFMHVAALRKKLGAYVTK